jgi:uncharacterized protein (DUF2237 family)
MSEKIPEEKNVLGGPLQACSFSPLTGFFRDGCCATHGEAGVAHLVCVKVTSEFLEFSRARGNDLSTPRPEMRFPRPERRRPLVPARTALGRGMGSGAGARASCSKRRTRKYWTSCRWRR